ncbi:phage tail protein [Methylobacterium durans]|uniref:Phage tail protein n=1 Tax=Methylobacterium durans TaxID=2202825 RepID=A0A2U8WHH9_9HYPH|nr:phage tail protein [Methylobacterium durans]
MRVLYAPEAVTLDWLLGPATETEGSGELVSAAAIALCTDRRAKVDDALPNPDNDDRRGWWGDTDAETLWDGWPIGSRLWLLERAKITGPNAREGSLLARVETYIREAIQPLKDKRICSRFAVQAERVGVDGIDASVTLFRGDEPEIELRFADLWRTIQV